nr:hypothetical protein [Tanacetum cinerariifolium]
MGVFTDHYIILGLPSGKQGTKLQASYEILKDEKTRKAFDVDLIRRLKHQELEKERKQRRIKGRLNMARGIKRINRMHEASKE